MKRKYPATFPPGNTVSSSSGNIIRMRSPEQLESEVNGKSTGLHKHAFASDAGLQYHLDATFNLLAHEPGSPLVMAILRLPKSPSWHRNSVTKPSPVHDYVPREAVGIGGGTDRSGDGGTRGVERSRTQGVN